ncbi:peptidoglycan-binding domain-containing protein [Flavicella sediminum]|uniref:peptidoglycan-binding domain-containing protein n=1 Tax=Flavicella sediminum TaxID=2585141 RepID=UPI001123976B|nr:peptidoglycan-binding domain-containing protein [Flavicella sediminum]
MKQLIIFLLLIIVGLIGYGKYNQYKRYHTSEINYSSEKTLDFDYHNQDLVLNYHNAIEDLNSFTKLQWTANNIDVRTPEEDDDATKQAVAKYSEKLATLHYYERKLENSANLKKDGLSNTEIKHLEETGTDLKEYQNAIHNKKIKNLYDPNTVMRYGHSSVLVYEVQKKLNTLSFSIKIDGLYKSETKDAITEFEEINDLFPDGIIDPLTLDALFK